MATAEERMKAIVDALCNRDVPVALVKRMMHATLQLTPQQVTDLTNTQKARQTVTFLLNQMKARVSEYEGGAAANTARATVEAGVDADFTESA